MIDLGKLRERIALMEQRGATETLVDLPFLRRALDELSAARGGDRHETFGRRGHSL